jgi:hypothetical protein
MGSMRKMITKNQTKTTQSMMEYLYLYQDFGWGDSGLVGRLSSIFAGSSSTPVFYLRVSKKPLGD